MNKSRSIFYRNRNAGTCQHLPLSPDDENDPDDLFGMNLGYQEDIGLGGSTPQFNGNISAMKWSSSLGMAEVKERGYNFSYDALNRLLGATHNEKTASWDASSAFQENNLTYDANGNIKTLTRTGSDEAAMDNLSYGYNGNQLMWVTDNGDKAKGFIDGDNSYDDYKYDYNGNLVGQEQGRKRAACKRRL